ncbi:DUF4861 family protein [Aquimarina aggregata]|uniref:DUF4861 family protein n=1 Tax=Aquimarina aggregata TaxID=1642818 RepID=UPI002492BAF1|nr:DUF4861 family protein [Aquimarina aggregata]
MVTNDLDVHRQYETVSLSSNFLKVDSLENYGVRDQETKKKQVVQAVDTDGDGNFDELLFQPKIEANSQKTFEIYKIKTNIESQKQNYCYSRFVPERTDDYAWENNKVAFRMFGPTAQKMVEDSIPGGTLSSGVDAWLKKVEYPIIDTWYHKETQTDGTYHEDTGEGLDNFHVGISRGVGGIAIKKNGEYYFSKNFTDWRTITNGPIRTSFYLKIEDWDANNNIIRESKIISLDYGNNLSKFEILINGSNHISPGLTLHENDGNIVKNIEQGWISYWQPHKGSELGTGIVAEKDFFSDTETYVVDTPDLSNAYVKLNVIDNKVVYYAGFGWKESKQFKNEKEWIEYLALFAKKINTPLVITLVN